MAEPSPVEDEIRFDRRGDLIVVTGAIGDGLLGLQAARGELGVLERTLSLGRVLQIDQSAVPDSGNNTLVLRVAQ